MRIKIEMLIFDKLIKTYLTTEAATGGVLLKKVLLKCFLSKRYCDRSFSYEHCKTTAILRKTSERLL